MLDCPDRPSSCDVLVSIIIPAYNSERTIDETLRSARAQTYRNVEIVVVDDGSIDRTADIVRQHMAEDGRIVLAAQANAGVAAARNHAISLTRGLFVAPLDADDLWHPTKIERQAALACSSAQPFDVVYNWYMDIDENSIITRLGTRHRWQGRVYKEMLRYNFIGNGSTPLIRRAALLECGGYDPMLRAQAAEGCEDFKLYLALSDRFTFGVIPQYLTGYRRSKNNMSSNRLQIVRSHAIVLDEVRRARPELSRIADRAALDIMGWYLRRTVAEGNIQQASQFIIHILRQDPIFALEMLARSGAPPIKRMAKAVLGRGSREEGFDKLIGRNFYELGIPLAVDEGAKPAGAVFPVLRG
jgi:glycosyltransferase involved in cell wall biosynthesis